MTFKAIPQLLERGVGYNLSMLHKILRFLFGKNVANFTRLQTLKVICTCVKKYWGMFFTHQ